MFNANRILSLLGLAFVSFTSGSSQNLPDRNGVQKPLGSIGDNGQTPLRNANSTLPALLNALDVLQADYFAIWQGIWPTSIDWTSAVIGTYLSAALTTLSTSFPSLRNEKYAENTVNKYFSQLTASYFGQDAFALRQEAYDDMLWVVLGWLESIKFIDTHSSRHYNLMNTGGLAGKWYGEDWTPAFAHRARIFWEMASQGWDTSLCSGGMLWSPYTTPYKNAITNELFIAASISMYLYFPGDDNSSPFSVSKPDFEAEDDGGRARDPKYLAYAIEAYKWLSSSNMTNPKGLYTDGFHISGWRAGQRNGSQNTKCDQRDEMVYTYNQGVLLSGQRGLYESTGTSSYLEDGHKLITDVIAATGWDMDQDQPVDEHSPANEPGWRLGKWYGLGRGGILEEACDAGAYCSQNGQTFKGIFFHHLTLFCAALPDHLSVPGGYFLAKGEEETPLDPGEVRKLHANSCKRYVPWVQHNAEGALRTLDSEGKFGMWWGAPQHSHFEPDVETEIPDGAIDYRNLGVPDEWKLKTSDSSKLMKQSDDFGDQKEIRIRDLNDRGRGRTVETQGGGIAVLRALWEMGEEK